MSPLAPQMNGNQSYNRMNQRNLSDSARILAPIDASKVTYSIGDLFEMRHNDRRAPNLGDRSVLASISRLNPGSTANYPSAFSFNIMSESVNQIQRDRRRPHSMPRHQNQGNGNGNHMNNSSNNDDRHRQTNRGK